MKLLLEVLFLAVGLCITNGASVDSAKPLGIAVPSTRDCTTGYLRLPCPQPIASSNKSLQGKDPLAFPLPDQKCLELGNILSVFQIKGEILVLKKNVQFLEFFGFILRFRTF